MSVHKESDCQKRNIYCLLLLIKQQNKSKKPQHLQPTSKPEKKHVESTPPQPELRRKRKTSWQCDPPRQECVHGLDPLAVAQKRSEHHQRTKQMSTRKQSKRGRRRQGIKRLYNTRLQITLICQYGRVVKAIDLKSIGVPPRRFEPCC